MKVFGTTDDRTIAQMQRCLDAEPGSVGVLCADNHLGYSAPIGSVIGYRNHISVSGVGYDIACGNLAVLTNLQAEDLSKSELERLANEIQARISFGLGRKNDEPVDDAVFDVIDKSIPEQRRMLQLARNQLGTVGSGNHYVDVLRDDQGRVWVACHFGSRGFGYKTATGFMNLANGKAWDDGHHEGEMDAPPTLLEVGTPICDSYLQAMQTAGDYAYAGRKAVIKKVLEILGCHSVFSVHNHHNFAWNEATMYGTLWVTRKGATPAAPCQHGFVGGSMGDISAIVVGVNSDEAIEALFSTVHGAGRVMSRTQAAGKSKLRKVWQCGQRNCNGELPIGSTPLGKDGSNPKCPKCSSKTHKRTYREQTKAGLIDFEAEKLSIAAKGIVLRGAGADEAPPVYRPLQSVLDAHAETIDVVHVLQPLIVVMAGSDEVDPYKD